MHLKSRLSLVTILGGVGLVLAAAPTVAQAAGGMGGIGGAAGASGGKAGAGGASGGAAGAAGTAGASGFTQAVKPKDGGAVAGTGNKTATYAVTCADDITGRCARTGAIVFDKKQDLPGLKGFEFDTGWIPANSPFQFKFALSLPAFTHVHLETPFIAQWPEAITLTTPGVRKTGELDFDYSLKTEAKARFEKEVLGQNVKFETDLPFVPKINFGVSGSRTFDPWAWDGIRGEGSTDPLELIKVNLAGYAGIPSAVGEAGVKVNLFGTLGVKYSTNRISIAPSDGPITKDQSSTVHDFQQGAWAEYKFHPEGTLDYDGTISLQPEVYIEVLNTFKFGIPVFQQDIPVKIPSSPYIFDDQLVHVPLPDLRLPKEGDTVDIGKITVGEPKLFQIAFPNIGEAASVATFYLDDAKTFQVLSKTATSEPGKDLVAKLAFYAAAPGPFTAKLLVASNDPDSPYIVINLKGESEDVPPDPTRPPPQPAGAGGAPVEEPPVEEEEEGGAGGIKATGGAGGKKARANAVPTSGDDGGCGCRVTPANEAPSGAAFSLLALTGLIALRGSRSRVRKSQSVVSPARNTAR